jgi:hypothetical protein
LNNKRKLLLALSGASTTAIWAKPVVSAVMLLAHAETTYDNSYPPGEIPPYEPPLPELPDCDNPRLLNILFKHDDSYITGIEWAANHDAADEPEKTESYVQAFAVWSNGVTEEVTTSVFWSTSNRNIAHTGAYLNNQKSSSFTTYESGTATISACLPDLCRYEFRCTPDVTWSYTVTINSGL